MPLYLTLEPAEDVLLRFPLESVVSETGTIAPRRAPKRGRTVVSEFYSGTRVTIDTTDGATSSLIVGKPLSLYLGLSSFRQHRL
jgi:hypothetical protein